MMQFILHIGSIMTKGCFSMMLENPPLSPLLQFVDMRSWRLVTADEVEVASVLNPLSNTVVADVQELPAAVLQLHWVLPQSYLGDRVRLSSVLHPPFQNPKFQSA